MQRAYALGQWYDIVGQAHGGGGGMRGGGMGGGMGMHGGPGMGPGMMRDRGDRHDRRDYWLRRQRRDFFPYGYAYGYDPYAYLYGYDGYGDGGDNQAAIWAAYFAGQQAAQQQQQIVPVPVPVPGGAPAPAPAGPPPGPPGAPAPGAPPVASGWYNLEGPAVGQWYDLRGPMVGADPGAGPGFPPRAALVEAPAPTQANRDILPMSTGVPILPTQSAQITGRPQTIAYKIGCYKISNAGTAGGAADWIVNDIKIGNRSQFVQSGDVPGDVFATNAIDTFVRFETAQTAMDVVVVVTYIGLNESGCPFFSAMIGTAAV